jgi:hypothetical protein
MRLNRSVNQGLYAVCRPESVIGDDDKVKDNSERLNN